MALTNGIVYLDGADLTSPVQSSFTLTAANNVQISSPNPQLIKVGINTNNGEISGTFTNPVTLQRNILRGALHQGRSFGSGYFLTTTQTGIFYIGD